MSGAVKAVQTVGNFLVDSAKAPLKSTESLYTSLRDGESLGKAMAKSGKEAIKPTMGVFGDFKQEFSGQQPPNIADPIDPAKVAEEQKKERARAKRQAEIDILTDRPGRGGTILTDNYTYNV